MNASTSLKKPPKKILLVCFGLFMTLFFGELLAAAYGYIRFSTFSVSKLYEAQWINTFISEIERQGNSYADTLFPHPYVGYVHKKSPNLDVNNVGFLGADYPYEKSTNQFVVLVTGGSVACQFAQVRKNGVRYLEDILNTRYDFGGKRVVVLNGGAGAWKQPQHTFLFLLYADVVDAVITLEGYNEHWKFTGKYGRMEMPPENFQLINPLAQYSFRPLVTMWISAKIRDFTKSFWLTRHSHLAWFLSHGITVYFQRSVRHPQGQEQTTMSSLFALPQEWTPEKYFAYNIEQYRKYIRYMQSIAGALGVRTAFFIQPVPAIGKKLTNKEIAAVGDLKYRDVYFQITKEMLELKNEGIPVYDLLHVFSDIETTIYADAIHCACEGPRNESEGYRLMAEAIAGIVEKEWGLKKKK